MIATAALFLTLAKMQQPDWTPETPVRVLLNITADPSKSATVTWRTMAAVKEPVAELAVASPDPRFTKDAKRISAKATRISLPKGGEASYYQADLTNLAPGTEYSYRVGDGKEWSEWVHFTTAAATPKPFNFIYFGDAQNDVKSMWSRAIRKAFRDAPYAAFMLHAGDLINRANEDGEWGEWFYAGGWTHSVIPSVAVPGNHEYAGAKDASGASKIALSTFWKPQFAMPENGIPGLERTNFYFDYQGARFIALNSNEKIEEQTPWLEQTLKSNPHKWVFVTFHHPVYSTAGERDNPKVRANWQPLFQKYNVAIVLQGHDHTYGRYNVPTGMQGQDKKSGTVYAVSVSGPKMYRLGKAKNVMDRVAEFTQLYQIIKVDQAKVRYEAYTVTGELYDAFELVKNKNGTNRFVDVKVTSKIRIEADKQAAAAKRLKIGEFHRHGNGKPHKH